MRAAQLLTGDELDLVEVADVAPGPGEVLIDVELAGVCGTDLHASAAGIAPGTVLGHEFTGRVIAVGTAVGDRVALGTRVVALPVRSCGRCVYCLSGDLVHCPQRTLVGNEPHAPGGFADRVIVGVDAVIPVPESLPLRHAALVEPLTVGLHVARRSGLRPSDNVMIVGAGPIGLAVTLWARHFGARRIVVSDPVSARRTMATACGATAVVDPGPASVARAWRSLGVAERPDVVIECTGRSDVLQQCLGVLPRHGRLTVSGMHNRPELLDLSGAYHKELTVIFSSWYAREEFAYVVQMLGDGRIDPTGLAVTVVGLDDLPAAFRAQKQPSTVGKLLVNPRG